MDIGFSFWTESFFRSIPELVGWTAGIVLAVIMLRRGGGRAEKMLLVACCLFFIMQLFNPFVNQIYSSLVEKENMSYLDTARTYGLIRMVYSVVLGIPGIVLIIWAFWIKFRVKKPEAA